MNISRRRWPVPVHATSGGGASGWAEMPGFPSLLRVAGLSGSSDEGHMRVGVVSRSSPYFPTSVPGPGRLSRVHRVEVEAGTVGLNGLE